MGMVKSSLPRQAIIGRRFAGVNRQTMKKTTLWIQTIAHGLISLGQALLATLALFSLLEGILFLAGTPYGGSHFVEKTILRASLPAKKAVGEYRIFAYGESTIHGAHSAERSSPLRWLERYLKDFLPDHNVRVVNFGRMGAGSSFAADAFYQTLPYKPDLAIFYLGHNNFLHGNQKHEIEAEQKSVGGMIRCWSMKSRLISEVSRRVIKRRLRRKTERPDDSMEFARIETPPSGIGPENRTIRTQVGYWDDIAFFRENILRILSLAETHQVKVLFYKPVCNLKDFAPWDSVHIKQLSPGELEIWNRWYEQGKEKQAEASFAEALDFFRQAHALDPTYADLSFRMGEIYFRMGELAEAKRFFEEARDYDAIIFRANKDVLTAFEQVLAEKNFPVIDTEKILVPEAPGGILGEPIIEDNVHFSLKGHSLAAKAAAREIADRGWIAPRGEWRFDRERSFEEISQELRLDEKPFLISTYLKLVNYFGSRFSNRVRFAQKALELDPDHPRALRYLAWTYWRMGEKAKALEAYKHLRQVDRPAWEEVLNAQPDIRKAFETSLTAKDVPGKARDI